MFSPLLTITDKLNLKTVLFIVFVACSNLSLYAQADDWKDIVASESMLELSRLSNFLQESYQWEPDERIRYLETGLDAAKLFNSDSLAFIYSKELGNYYRELDSISQSLQYIHESLGYAYSPRMFQISFNLLGGIHSKNKDYQTALEYYFKSLDEAEKMGGGAQAFPIGNISEVYYNLEDYTNAVKYLNYSIGYSRELESPVKEYSLVYDYSYKLGCFLKMNEMDSAAATLEKLYTNIKVIETENTQRFKDACFVGYYSVADYYIEINQSDEAKEAIQLCSAMSQPIYESSINILKAKNLILQKDYRQALKILNNKKTQEEYSGKDDILSLKIDCFLALGNYKQAYEIKAEQHDLQSETFSQDLARYSSFASSKYDNLKQNEEIKNLKQIKKIDKLTIQSQRYFMLSAFALIGLAALGFFFMWRRYKDRKQLNIELQEQVNAKTKDLIQANEELKVLNFVASHDIKEPIRNIGNYVGLIKIKLPKAEQTKLNPYFETISNSIKQLYTLVEDIGRFISISNNDEMERSKIDLNKLVDDIQSSIEMNLKEKNAILHKDDLPTIITNNTAIYVILKNLIENGVKFNKSTNPTVWINYSKSDLHHHITVKDNGIGIDSKHQSTIFQSFKRLNNRKHFEGSGVGLAIVKVLIEKIGGSIKLESVLNEGSSFVLNIPILDEEFKNKRDKILGN